MAATDLIDLDDARKALRLAASDTTRDADLAETYVPAVTDVVEDVVGPVVSRSFTRTVDGGTVDVVLGHKGVTVTSVVEDGTTLSSSTDYLVNAPAGIVSRGTSTSRFAFTGGRRNVVVTYTAGIADDTAAVPAAIKLAARLILAAMWQADQQGTRPQFGTNEQGTTTTPSGYAIPRRAYALLEPYSTGLAPGFA